FRPSRIARDKDWDVIDKAESGFQRATGIKSCGLLGPDGKIIDHQFRRGIFQLGDNLFARGFLLERKKCAQRILILHVWRIAIQNAAHFYNRASELDLFIEHLCAIWGRKNSSAHVQADLAPVNIVSSDNFNVTRTISADLTVHQANAGTVDRGTTIKIDSLHERTGAVSHAHDCDSDFSHFLKTTTYLN